MRLVWNEIVHYKLRCSLIVKVIFLIDYLVSFLTESAYGLTQDY
ncbi:hypothetical protein [Enterococcus sp. BWT-B8]